MKQNRINAVRVGSSNHAERLAELKANHESQELKNLIERGFSVKNVEVKHRRPRIKVSPKPRYVVTLVFGKELQMTIEEFNTKGAGFKKIREIY